VGAPRLRTSIQFHDLHGAGNRDLGLAVISSASVAFRQRSGLRTWRAGRKSSFSGAMNGL